MVKACFLILSCLLLGLGYFSLHALETNDEQDGLKAKIEGLEKENEKLKNELKTKNKQLKKLEIERRHIDLYIAALGLHIENNQDSIRILPRLKEAMAALKEKQEELLQRLLIFKHFLKEVFQLKEEGNRKELGTLLLKRLDLLIDICASWKQLFSYGQEQDKKNANLAKLKNQSRILDINNQLNVIVIDVGLLDGIFPGMLWAIKNNKDKEIVVLRIIETRAQFSAAVIDKGKMSDLFIGQTLLRKSADGKKSFK